MNQLGVECKAAITSLVDEIGNCHGIGEALRTTYREHIGEIVLCEVRSVSRKCYADMTEINRLILEKQR